MRTTVKALLFAFVTTTVMTAAADNSTAQQKWIKKAIKASMLCQTKGKKCR